MEKKNEPSVEGGQKNSNTIRSFKFQVLLQVHKSENSGTVLFPKLSKKKKISTSKADVSCKANKDSMKKLILNRGKSHRPGPFLQCIVVGRSNQNCVNQTNYFSSLNKPVQSAFTGDTS